MPLTQVAERRLAKYRKPQVSELKQLRDPPEFPTPRRNQELDPRYTRLSLGVDFLAYVVLDHESETSRIVAVEMARPEEGPEFDSLSLAATHRALKSQSYFKWMRALDSRIIGAAATADPAEYHVSLRRPDLKEWLPPHPVELAIVNQSAHAVQRLKLLLCKLQELGLVLDPEDARHHEPPAIEDTGGGWGIR